MTAPAQLSLSRRSPLGVRWSWLVEEADPYLRPVDPWRLYPVDLGAMDLPTELLGGPAIYGALGGDSWQYCGQTLQPLHIRLAGHARDGDSIRRAAKAARWVSVAVLPLVEQTPGNEVRRLERKGQELLRPRMGSRWSRVA